MLDPEIDPFVHRMLDVGRNEFGVVLNDDAEVAQDNEPWDARPPARIDARQGQVQCAIAIVIAFGEAAEQEEWNWVTRDGATAPFQRKTMARRRFSWRKSKMPLFRHRFIVYLPVSHLCGINCPLPCLPRFHMGSN